MKSKIFMDKHPVNPWEALEEVLKFFGDIGVTELAAPVPSPDSSPSPKSIQEEYGILCRGIRQCRKCRLSRSRTQAVPGEGNLSSDLMFVGEGPGKDEDIQGRPFVGEAGRLLSRIIKAMTFTREDVYITNIVKCRPPRNRDPQPDEIEMCQGYLFQQIGMIQPKVIVTLGNVPTRFFLKTTAGITSLRGSFHSFGNIKIMPTFHPSYLIRRRGDLEIKRKVWHDMQEVMSFLGKK